MKSVRNLFLLVFLISQTAHSQQKESTDNIYAHPILSFHYSINNSAFQWKERFGLFNTIGLNIGYKTKRNWYYLGEGNFYFGNQTKEDQLLNNLKDSYGNITDDQGNIAVVPVFSRGLSSSLILGKLISFNGNKNESGLLLNFGIGFLSYKYRVETNSENIPQIEKDYTKGYDRLTQGLLFSEYIGYQIVSEKELLNFNIGLYFNQAITHNVRTIFFDQPNKTVSKNSRLDGSYGLRVGWNIPFFNNKPKDFYYY
jgi:hypothetical protein